MNSVEDCILINIPQINSEAGRLSVAQGSKMPFDVKRVYYTYDIPSGAERGGHAHKALQQLIIAASGSFEVIIDDGHSCKSIFLNKPNIGLLVKPGIWREINNFSSGSVVLVLASDVYTESDYIRNYEDFKLHKK
ncbi:WxcM-like domain-containing protein [Carboxylicivirga mesophila]|uniref:WxcM-like domain-containing protein n=1 Tax=Carboxylicivirga mesophila TaxID=1166478 RepID=A0ABS5K4M6_9BACT|nr:FdtA/QdtA family cupin domain-containing protein [Carboxylicivirga mesophila]MBS2209964.1 WxcM-like domain-containing protein [Carboxylicivirga mesophila]